MEYQDQLKLQSYLDGELSKAEAREVSAWLARDQEAMALATELRQTNAALGGFEQEVRLPESHDFHWSKIKRQIEHEERLEPAPAAVVPWSVRLRRFMMPLTGLAVAALLLLVVTHESGSGPGDTKAETALQDSGAFTYHDSNAGATLVWLSYPADEEFTQIDDPDSFD